jgi:hypothetical protein
MHDNFASLSARTVALRVLPAAAALLMLIVGPPQALWHRAPTVCGNVQTLADRAAHQKAGAAPEVSHPEPGPSRATQCPM